MYKKIIKENELGVEWEDGKIVGLLKPGLYAFSRRFGRKADIFDTRLSVLRVAGQEVLLADKISVKVNITGTYKISDPVKLLRQIDKNAINEHVTQLTQLGVRDVLATKTLADITEKRNELNGEFIQQLEAAFSKVGIVLVDARVKDVILPADIRTAYTQSLTAQLKSKAQLEQARGQSAVLRNLANTADLIEKHPQLIQLMGLQRDGASLNIHLDSPTGKSKD